MIRSEAFKSHPLAPSTPGYPTLNITGPQGDDDSLGGAAPAKIIEHDDDGS